MTSASMASSVTDVANTRGLQVSLTHVGQISFSHANSRLPVIRTLSVTDAEFLGSTNVRLRLTLTCLGREMCEPWEVVVPRVGAEPVVFDGSTIQLGLKPLAFAEVDERMAGEFLVEVTSDGGAQFTRSFDVDIVAYNQWQLYPTAARLKDSLATLAPFVQPNHPAVEEVVRRARDILESSTDSASTEGYQGDAARVLDIVRAVYLALQERRIRYSDPPASWDAQTQKVRLVPDVLGRATGAGVGTCLDTAITFASCVAAAGLHPVLIVIPGHALLGVLTGKMLESGARVHQLPTSVVTETNVFSTLVEGGFLLPIETTALTRSREIAFSDAVDEGGRRLAGARLKSIEDGDGRGFLGAVDVRLANQNGLRPLPAVLKRGDSVEIVEYRSFTPPDFAQAARPTRRTISGRTIRDESPGRIQNWKRALLDLSANNPLLKLPSRGTVARAFVPPGALAKLEDFLHDHGVVRLSPLTEVTSEDLARGVQSVAQLEADQLAARLFQQRQLFLTYGADTYLPRLRALQRKAKTSLEESGSTSLFIGFGTLRWTLEGKAMESPLVLAPARLTGGTGRSKFFDLSLDDSGASTPNYCLLEKLDELFDLKIPGLREPEEDGLGLDIDKALQAVREAILERELPFAVDEGLVLGNFQFSTFRIWKDVDEHWARFLEAPVVKHLVEHYNDDFPTPASPDYPETSLPLPADESQYDAIQAAIAGETFVLEGPPGTGKSQTITNIIAGALAAGKRVLFVAEKKAALDVVKQRLGAVGAGAFALDLHGKSTKRSEVAAAIREALEVQTDVDRIEVDTVRTELRSTARELDRYAAALHSTDDVGYSIWSARQRLLAAGEGPTLAIDLEGVSLSDERLAEVRSALENFPDVARLASPVEVQAWALAGPQARTSEVTAALDRFCTLTAVLPTDHPVIGAALAAARSTDDVSALLRLIEKPLPPAAVIDQVRSPGWEYLFDTWRRTVIEWSTPPPFLGGYRPEVLFAPLDRWLDAARSAAASGLFARKRKLIEAAKPLTSYSLTGTDVEPDQLVPLMSELVAHRDRIVHLRNGIVDAVPGMELASTWHPYGGAGIDDMDRRRRELTAVSHLLTNTTEAGRALRAIPGSVVSIDQVTAANLSMVAQAWEHLRNSLGADDTSTSRWQGGRPLLVAWEDSRQAWQADSAGGLRRLQRVIDLHTALAPLSDAGLREAVTQLVTGTIAPFDALAAFERGLAQASLARAFARAGLASFDAESHDLKIHRFARADARWRIAQSALIPEAAAGRRPFAPGTVTGQVGDLLREVNKTRGGKSLRYLLEHFHETLSTIMPCFLMSPDSVAQYLRPGLFTFDMVVVDEASQVRVAEAVGALGRARSAVIVGDSKQMPPSGFGSSSVSDEEWDPFATELVVPADQESILTECIQSRIPRRWLSWHYRSQAEGLIAFSNANYYEGRLASFPTPNDQDPRMGLRFVHVLGGQFLRNAKGAQLRTNPVEAAAVVADIRRRLHDPVESKDSIGVVTFNAQQQALIDSLLLDSDDEVIREAYSRDGDDRLFVKNLENVQGDERDVILFSLAYSKDDTGKLPMQWGPLNSEGGERRLNVAITRARRQVVVFCSFQPEDIDLSRSSAKAVSDLRSYLLMARDGVESNVALIARKPSEADRHRAQISAALRAAGLHVEEDKGLSDFRVDLVVAPPDEPSTPALVVLLDGPRWGRGARTQDRDVVPVEVLGNLMGWPDVMRIWLPDWMRDPESVVQRVYSRAMLASAALRNRTDPDSSTPEPSEKPEKSSPKPALDPPGPAPDGRAEAAVPPSPAPPVVSPAPSPVKVSPLLTKGANVLIADGAADAPTDVVVGLGWETPSSDVTLDGSALVLGADEQVLSEQHFVFYNNRATPDRSVLHRGNSAASSGDREEVAVKLSDLPADVDRVVFVVSIDDPEGAGHTFRRVQRAHIRIASATDGAELARYDVATGVFANETAMIFGELYRRGSEWKFRAIGQGYATGLAGVATDFGVSID